MESWVRCKIKKISKEIGELTPRPRIIIKKWQFFFNVYKNRPF